MQINKLVMFKIFNIILNIIILKFSKRLIVFLIEQILSYYLKTY